jgi:hypothetical protein
MIIPHLHVQNFTQHLDSHSGLAPLTKGNEYLCVHLCKINKVHPNKKNLNERATIMCDVDVYRSVGVD